jgi:hypothetical protein
VWTHQRASRGVGATVADKEAAGLAAVDTVHGAGYADPGVHELWRPDFASFAANAGKVSDAFARLNITIGVDTKMVVRQLDQFSHHLNGWVGWQPAPGPGRAKRRTKKPDPAMAVALADLPPKERALARKRRPFICPRHGTQPGGFCRTCQRTR